MRREWGWASSMPMNMPSTPPRGAMPKGHGDVAARLGCGRRRLPAGAHPQIGVVRTHMSNRPAAPPCGVNLRSVCRPRPSSRAGLDALAAGASNALLRKADEILRGIDLRSIRETAAPGGWLEFGSGASGQNSAFKSTRSRTLGFGLDSRRCRAGSGRRGPGEKNSKSHAMSNPNQSSPLICSMTLYNILFGVLFCLIEIESVGQDPIDQLVLRWRSFCR